MRLISLDRVTPGDVCAIDVRTANNVLVMRGGSVLNLNTIQRLRSFSFTDIYIDDEISKGIETSFALNDKTVKNLLSALYSQNIDQLISLSGDMVSELGSNLFENDMKMLRAYDSYTEQHSISVATYATVLGKAIGLNQKNVELIAQAGLFHDIGKLQIDQDIIKKPGKLTEDEYIKVMDHSDLGYRALQERSDILSVVRVGVREHHENEDGSGYPMHLKGDKIHLIGKILHIADVFDALTTKRSYKEEWSNKDALMYIRENAGILFDKAFAEVFSRCVPYYPKGTIVELSDGTAAIVLKNYVEAPERPFVRSIYGEEMDLFSDENYKHLYIEGEMME